MACMKLPVTGPRGFVGARIVQALGAIPDISAGAEAYPGTATDFIADSLLF